MLICGDLVFVDSVLEIWQTKESCQELLKQAGSLDKLTMNYPIADMLIRIKNASLARHKELVIPYSKMSLSISKILVARGFIEDIDEDRKKKEILVKLKFIKRKPAITEIKIISKPSLRVYVSKKGIPRVLGNLGTAILSTPSGLMTAQEARKKGLGGEVICEVW